MRPLALTATVLLGGLVAGCPADRLRLVDRDTGSPLAETVYELWIDDGVRCITTPCPTSARSVQGKTDAAGRLARPELGPEESVTVTVEGYLPGSPPSSGGDLRLQPRKAPEPPAPGLTLRSKLLPGTATLEVSVKNQSPVPLTLVRPRADRLQRYGEWGGWHLLVKLGGDPFLPDPLPGPFIPASPEDLITLEPGAEIDATLQLQSWRRATPGQPQSQGQQLLDAPGRLEVRLRWSEIPTYLKAKASAPRAITSARTHLKP